MKLMRSPNPWGSGACWLGRLPGRYAFEGLGRDLRVRVVWEDGITSRSSIEMFSDLILRDVITLNRGE